MTGRRPRLLPPALRDPVVRMIVLHWISGAGIGAMTAALVWWLDIANLRTLLAHSDIEWAGLLMLFAGFAITFGGAVSAGAVMFNPVSDEEPNH